jgi:hypothetical protein
LCYLNPANSIFWRDYSSNGKLCWCASMMYELYVPCVCNLLFLCFIITVGELWCLVDVIFCNFFIVECRIILRFYALISLLYSVGFFRGL